MTLEEAAHLQHLKKICVPWLRKGKGSVSVRPAGACNDTRESNAILAVCLPTFLRSVLDGDSDEV